eukprot:scaffold1525_cov142-Cylindrotheca_fusiformis.AAC.73
MGMPLLQRRPHGTSIVSRFHIAVIAKLCFEHNGDYSYPTVGNSLFVCMILPGGGSRLQTLGRLAAQVPRKRMICLPLCVHDPAWWWVKASNLGTPSGVVVRFNLAHVSGGCPLATRSFIDTGKYPDDIPFVFVFVCMILPGGESRLQTLGRLATELFDSTLRTFRVAVFWDDV